MQTFTQTKFETLNNRVDNLEKLLANCSENIRKNNKILEDILLCVESLRTDSKDDNILENN